MKLFSFFSQNPDPISLAKRRVVAFELLEKELIQKKEDKMQRQVELWSILTPTPDLEKEYKKVSAEIALLVKKLLALEEHGQKLRLARMHCEQGSCNELSSLLKVLDPTATITLELPSQPIYK